MLFDKLGYDMLPVAFVPAVISFILSIYTLIQALGFKGSNTTKKVRLIFIRMCILLAIASAACVLGKMTLMQYNNGEDYSLFYRPLTIYSSIYEILYLSLVLNWLILVDYLSNGSEDHLKRKYPKERIPMIVIIALLLVFVLVMAITRNVVYLDIFIIIELICDIFEIIYMLRAAAIVRDMHKDRMTPVLFSQSIFIAPFIVGYILDIFILDTLASLGYAVGILLTWNTIRRLHGYIDRDSGFYNRAFLDKTIEYLDTKKDVSATGIVFVVTEGAKEFTDIIKELAPGNNEIFLTGEGVFFLLSPAQRENEIRYFISFITKAAGQAGQKIEFTSDYGIKEAGESTRDFVEKLIGKNL